MRKSHNSVSQEELLEAITEVGGSAILEDIAEHFDVSTQTARRGLDGLVHQGKLKVFPGQRGRNHREYQVCQ